MLAAELDVAQRAKEAPAGIARQHRFLVRVIKAAGLAFGDKHLAALRGRRFLEQRGEDFHKEWNFAGRAAGPDRLIERRFVQYETALGAGHSSHPAQRLWTTRVLQMWSCRVRFCSSKAAMM